MGYPQWLGIKLIRQKDIEENKNPSKNHPDNIADKTHVFKTACFIICYNLVTLQHGFQTT
jgi:hypothetical protein